MSYEDDLSIADETRLLRRIPVRPDVNIVWDGNNNRWRPSSASFDNHPDGSPMSVVLGDALSDMGRSYESAMGRHGDDFALVAFTAGVARENAQGVAREPVEDEPAHGVVFGNKTKRVKRNIAKNSFWIIPPEIPEPA